MRKEFEGDSSNRDLFGMQAQKCQEINTHIIQQVTKVLL